MTSLENSQNLDHLIQTQSKLSHFLLETRLVKSEILSFIFNNNIFLKLESEQVTQSFKIRGALNFILNAVEDAKKSNKQEQLCISTYTTGNHGIATAYIATILNIKIKIFAPFDISPNKIAKILSYKNQNTTTQSNIELILTKTRQEAEDGARAGGEFMHPSGEKEDIVDGVASISLEIIEQLKKFYHSENILNFDEINRGEIDKYNNFYKSINNLSSEPVFFAAHSPRFVKVQSQKDHSLYAIFAPCGGGGLLSGLYKGANFYHLANQESCAPIKIFGCEPEEANDAYLSIKNQSIYRFKTSPNTIADSLKALSLSKISFSYIQKINEMILINENLIIDMHKIMNQLHRQEIFSSNEISSSLVLGALFYWKKNNPKIENKNIVLIISGNNM